MLFGMTAFGKVHVETAFGRFDVQISSVNRRHLETRLSAPPYLSAYEPEIKKRVAARLGRGQISIHLNAIFENHYPLNIRPNTPLLRRLKETSEETAAALGIDGKSCLELLLHERAFGPLFSQEFEGGKESETALFQALDGALDALIEMRKHEGTTLQKDLLERLARLSALLEKIAHHAGDVVPKYETKLKDRLLAFSEMEDIDERVGREIVLYVDKIDITEEIVRFRHHLSSFEDQLTSKQHASGKQLEFICQELGRETNTMGSKSQDLTISDAVIEIKAELERIREQLHNVE